MNNRVHALSHEMESKSTRTKLTRRLALECVRVRLRTTVNENYFQSRFRPVRAVEFVKPNLDGTFEFAAVRVPNDVGDGFVQSERDLVAVLFPKTDRAGKRRDSPPDTAKDLGIAQELKPHEKLPAWQGKSSERRIVTEIEGLPPIARGGVGTARS